MKCPKCGYLGFEAVDRCRNCGYDFSFSPASTAPELSMRSADVRDMQPLDDLALVDSAARVQDGDLRRGAGADLDRGAQSDNADPALPLFGAGGHDDLPLITRASPPRQPLSVRRATPEVPRLRSEQRPQAGNTPLLDLELPEAEPRAGSTPAGGSLRRSRASIQPETAAAEAAGLASRVVAVAIDLLVLAVTDLAVIYFTMQICGLTRADLGILPKGPLIAFLLVQNGGYLVAFTAGGQTLGKMAAGIRVVCTDPDASLDLGHSAVRTLVWALLAIPAGLGFLTAIFSRDRRGLHDRCAGTRVVRAAA
jgi:uncharacterized RDD family membrane protein YckC